MVRIVDLTAATHLNGAIAKCIRWDPDAGRWIVQICSGSKKAIKPQNLEITRQLRVDGIVRVSGLTSHTHLNGSVGTCVQYVQETGRWIIRTSHGQKFAMRPENLEICSQSPRATNAESQQVNDRRGQSRNHSRSRSRSASLDGSQRLTFGPHAGRDFEDVFLNEVDYCRRVLSMPRSRGPLHHFTAWLQHQIMQGNNVGQLPIRHQSQPRPVARSARGHGLTQAPAPAVLSETVERLPRIPFKKDMFSGDTYPDACPICFEDWEDVKSDIVLTPCFHVFHACCLDGWIGERKDCPSCRCDVTETGEAKAISESSARGFRHTAASSSGNDPIEVLE